jgi:uracil-DNA glycosylase
MHTVTLPQPDDFEAWRDAARALVLSKTSPDQIIWCVGSHDDLFANNDSLPRGEGNLSVPRAFIDLAKSAICHSDAERFALLYMLLWRLQDQRALISDHADPLMRRIDDLAKSVRRDIHGRSCGFVKWTVVMWPGSSPTIISCALMQLFSSGDLRRCAGRS